MARKMHYSNVHDRGAVIALEDCSADDRRERVQACNESWQEEQIRATHYDSESDSEMTPPNAFGRRRADMKLRVLRNRT